MIIIDAFLYYNEQDLLKLRKEELKDCVDIFLPLSSTHTFTNRTIIYPEGDVGRDIPQYGSRLDPDPWVNEENQRNQLFHEVVKKVLQNNLNPDDVLVMFSDCDEIPSVEAVEEFKDRPRQSYFRMIPHYYGINCRSDESYWPGTFITPYNQINQTVESYRKGRHGGPFFDGGWHFSYCMGVNKIVEKIESFSHQEFNSSYYKDKDRLETIIKEGKDLFDRNISYSIVPVNETFPKTVQNNPENWKHLII